MQQFNFNDNKYVFVTITTFEQRPILLENVSVLKTAIVKSKQNYNYDFFACVILPAQILMIIKPEPGEDYPKIVANIKQYFTVNLPSKYRILDSSQSKQESLVWQKRFEETTIRNKTELRKYLNYMHYAPVKQGLAEMPKDWQYSSFKKFVMLGFYDENWTCTKAESDKLVLH